MKKLLILLLLCVCVFGCQSETKAPETQDHSQSPKVPKTLDWNKSASEQNLKIGDTISVEGIAYNIFPYEYKPRRVSGIGGVTYVAHLDRSFYFPPEHDILLYNPEQPVITKNPNVAIGAVVCTIYNPSYSNAYLGFDENRDLYRMYPGKILLESEDHAIFWSEREYRDNKEYEHLIKRLSEYLIVEHKFQLIGTIQGFERRVLSNVHSNNLSLRCVDIVVSDIKSMESEKTHEKLDH